VSLTGILDNKMMSNQTKDSLSSLLSNLRLYAVSTNRKWAKLLGIEPSTAITCVKPSGTVSQLVDASSGIHPRHSEYYIRTVRADKKDPLTLFMTKEGFPVEDEFLKPHAMSVFSFPMKSPVGALTRNKISAIDHLKIWQIYSDHWCEHKPSITVSVQEDEWMKVGGYVYENFDSMSGISFLPMSEHIYKQAPYQDCTKVVYDKLLKRMPVEVNWKTLSEYEDDDNTRGTQTYSCSGDVCEIVDIVQ
jgi:ribonucleoside-diphosphate reductase alpha chain